MRRYAAKVFRCRIEIQGVFENSKYEIRLFKEGMVKIKPAKFVISFFILIVGVAGSKNEVKKKKKKKISKSRRQTRERNSDRY